MHLTAKINESRWQLAVKLSVILNRDKQETAEKNNEYMIKTDAKMIWKILNKPPWEEQ